MGHAWLEVRRGGGVELGQEAKSGGIGGGRRCREGVGRVLQQTSGLWDSGAGNSCCGTVGLGIVAVGEGWCVEERWSWERWL